MIKNNTLRLTAAGALYCSAILFTATSAHAATFLASDITTWIGPAAGAGISEGVLVIQWPGQTAWAWGIRWDSTQTRNGRDNLLALAGVDARFTFTGTSFIGDLKWDANLDGTPEFTFPGYDADGQGSYLNYFVNNGSEYDYTVGTGPDAYDVYKHKLPPLGSPYDEAGPGEWLGSVTGLLARPLADGSWDGWVYSNGNVLPSLPVNAPLPVPESSTGILVLLTGGLLLRRKR